MKNKKYKLQLFYQHKEIKGPKEIYNNSDPFILITLIKWFLISKGYDKNTYRKFQFELRDTVEKKQWEIEVEPRRLDLKLTKYKSVDYQEDNAFTFLT